VKKICILGTMLVLMMVLAIMPSSILADSANDTKCAIAPASGETNDGQDFSGITSFSDVTLYNDFEMTQPLSSEVNLNEAVKRYIVLLLDTTGQKTIFDVKGDVEVGAPFDEVVKPAAINFVKQVLYQSGDNYLAVVGFNETVNLSTGFSKNAASLENAINKDLIENGTWVNTKAALLEAERLLNEITDPDAIKNIVYFSGWMPTEGDYSMSGAYSTGTYSYYRVDNDLYVIGYCNPALATARQLMNNGCNIYTLGCFTNLEDHDKTYVFTNLFMNDMSGNSKRFYNAKNPEDLYFVFGNVIEDIWGALWWQEYNDRTIWQDNGNFSYNMIGYPHYKGHLGIDLQKIKNPPDDVVAVTRGDVIFAGDSGANGNTVVIEHNISNTIFYSAYFHLASFDDKIKSASIFNPIPVYSGQKLGIMGHTGAVTGDHVHLTIYQVTQKDSCIGSTQVIGGNPETNIPGWLKTSFDYGEFLDVNATNYTVAKWWLGNDTNIRFYDPEKVISGTSSFVSMANYTTVINIECPVDVNVYDSQDNLVASIVNNEVVINILPTFVSDNSKEVHLTQDDNYRIEITATDDGVMRYLITEKDYQFVPTRKVTMNEIPLTKDEVFTSYVNTIKGTMSETYTLSSSKGQTYYADEDLTGSELFAITVTLHSVFGNEEIVTRSYKVIKDFEASICAYTTYLQDEDWEFVGWYENGVKIEGAEGIYGFVATEDRELTAYFVPKPQPIFTIIAETSIGGKVSGGGMFERGSEFTITAIPNVGYTFDGWYYEDGRIFSSNAEFTSNAYQELTLKARFTSNNPFGINIRDISIGNNQANIDFDIVSASGKDYSVYLSLSEDEGMFKLYADVNYNSKGVHIKGLTNGETYYVYIAYSDAGSILRSNVIKFTVAN